MRSFNHAKKLPGVYYLGRTRTPEGDHIVTLSIRSQRYDYYLTAPQADATEYLCKRVSALKALSFAKSRARMVLKI